MSSSRDSRYSPPEIDETPDGQTPYTLSLCNYDDLVDVAKPGDRYIYLTLELKLRVFSVQFQFV